jgi:hypothetical protein
VGRIGRKRNNNNNLSKWDVASTSTAATTIYRSGMYPAQAQQQQQSIEVGCIRHKRGSNSDLSKWDLPSAHPATAIPR